MPKFIGVNWAKGKGSAEHGWKPLGPAPLIPFDPEMLNGHDGEDGTHGQSATCAQAAANKG